MDLPYLPTYLPTYLPAASSQVGGMILGGHDGCLEVLYPDPCRPVAHRHEELVVGRVALLVGR